LVEAAARHRDDARVLVGVIDLMAGRPPGGRRLGRLAAGLLAAGLIARRRRPGRPPPVWLHVLGLFARMALFGLCPDFARCCDLAQTLLAARQFVGNRQAARKVRRVRRLGTAGIAYVLVAEKQSGARPSLTRSNRPAGNSAAMACRLNVL
jgi:hypothetical protein